MSPSAPSPCRSRRPAPAASSIPLAFLLLAAVAFGASGQETTTAGTSADDPVPTELQTGFDDMIEVSEVFLDVIVTDRRGEVVRGLDATDFVIREQGEPVPITSASYYTTRYGDVGAAKDEVPSSRYFVFFFHDQAVRGGPYGVQLMRQQMRAAHDARQWIEDGGLLPSDWAAVASFRSSLIVQQDFTQDRGALIEALKRAGSGKKPAEFRPGRREALDRGRELDILGRLPTGRALRDATPNVYLGLREVAEAMGFLVGRKALFLYTTGFGKRRSGSRFTEPDPRFYGELEPILNDHNVAIYPVDLSLPGRPPAEEHFLQRLADDTGGYYDPNFVGFVDPLERIADDNVGYYLVTYRSARPAGEIGYQRLEVEVLDPELQVRARKGYRYGL